MIKTWGSRILVECRAIEFGGTTMAEFYGINEVYTIEESILTMLNKFEGVFY